MEEPPAEVKAKETMMTFDDWKTFMSEGQSGRREDGRSDSMENAFNAKYKEFLGEGKFLIDEREEAELSAEVLIELPVQEAEVVPTEEADTWLVHEKTEEASLKLATPTQAVLCADFPSPNL
ncbi:hypothetical protein SLS61_001979 [Didymella pomorum]